MSIEQDEPWMRCEVCGKPSDLPPVSCLLGQPISVTYCLRCYKLGVEVLYVVEGVLGSLLPGVVSRAQAEGILAPWALEVIDRSLQFHGKTWDGTVAEVFARLPGEAGLEG